jgi:hypothetical protein
MAKGCSEAAHSAASHRIDSRTIVLCHDVGGISLAGVVARLLGILCRITDVLVRDDSRVGITTGTIGVPSQPSLSGRHTRYPTSIGASAGRAFRAYGLGVRGSRLDSTPGFACHRPAVPCSARLGGRWVRRDRTGEAGRALAGGLLPGREARTVPAPRRATWAHGGR